MLVQITITAVMIKATMTMRACYVFPAIQSLKLQNFPVKLS
jgi:hypothetical protein